MTQVKFLPCPFTPVIGGKFISLQVWQSWFNFSNGEPPAASVRQLARWWSCNQFQQAPVKEWEMRRHTGQALQSKAERRRITPRNNGVPVSRYQARPCPKQFLALAAQNGNQKCAGAVWRFPAIPPEMGEKRERPGHAFKLSRILRFLPGVKKVESGT